MIVLHFIAELFLPVRFNIFRNLFFRFSQCRVNIFLSFDDRDDGIGHITFR
ncbi:MAG: hypothetical protein K0R28_313, partial [Paenibacillus sp.]|nr:hypothetical protein [Paenibacillus sp.]